MLNIAGIDPTYFNRASREIIVKIDIYFNGILEQPVIILPSNYLVDMELTEEAGAESSNPLGSVSANELTFTLLNYDNIFSPTNSEGPYYGRINVGVPVKAWIKPADPLVLNWIPLGTFFVSEWSCRLGDGMADVTCADKVQELLRAPIPDMNVLRGATFENIFRYVFTCYGFTEDQMEVDPLLTESVQYAFIHFDGSAQYFQCLTEAAIAFIISTRYGKIAAKKFKRTTAVDTFTDSTQIMSINVEQSILKTYQGVQLKYALPQLSDTREVLTIEDLPVPIDRTVHNTFLFENPVFNISGVYISSDKLVVIEEYLASINGIQFTTFLDDADPTTARVVVSGKNVDLVLQELSDAESDVFMVENNYIQTTEYAETYKEHLEQFVSLDIPSITLNTRGNPLLEIGDTIDVESERYGITLAGIIKRMHFKYNGGLSCEVTLLNAEVV